MSEQLQHHATVAKAIREAATIEEAEAIAAGDDRAPVQAAIRARKEPPTQPGNDERLPPAARAISADPLAEIGNEDEIMNMMVQDHTEGGDIQILPPELPKEIEVQGKKMGLEYRCWHPDKCHDDPLFKYARPVTRVGGAINFGKWLLESKFEPANESQRIAGRKKDCLYIGDLQIFWVFTKDVEAHYRRELKASRQQLDNMTKGRMDAPPGQQMSGVNVDPVSAQPPKQVLAESLGIK